MRAFVDAFSRTACATLFSLFATSSCLDADGGEVVAPDQEVDVAGAIDAGSPVKPYVGSYRFVGGDTERRRVAEAIDGAVAKMNVLVRGFARSRLTDGNFVPDTITVDAGSDALAIALDDKRQAGPMFRPTRVETMNGEVMTMTFHVGQTLEQAFSDDEKGRVNRFELAGDKLVMHVRVHAEQLPEDLTYSLTYERM